nr:hypothetical protein [Tanacetum cinerariifolium]
MLPEMLEDPYVKVALQAPPSPDYVPGLEHAEDKIVAEDQPYTEDASPIAQSPEYVPESDFEAHPEDDENEDPEEDLVDYPADGRDDGDDEEESSEDDEDEEDDEMDVEADKEEHPAPSDSVVVAPIAADQAPSAEETEQFETDESAATPPPHPVYRRQLGFLFQLQYLCQHGLIQRPEVTLPHQKKLVETLQGVPVSTDMELDGYMREFETRVRQDTKEIYMRLDDEQNASDLVRGEVMSLRTTVLGHMTEIRELHATDRRRQTVISELPRADHRRSTKIIELRTALQGQVTALQGQVTALQAQLPYYRDSRESLEVLHSQS